MVHIPGIGTTMSHVDTSPDVLDIIRMSVLEQYIGKEVSVTNTGREGRAINGVMIGVDIHNKSVRIGLPSTRAYNPDHRMAVDVYNIKQVRLLKRNLNRTHSPNKEIYNVSK